METIIIAILVCLARMIDVTMGTLKLKAIMRGSKLIAFCIAFFEVIIYTLAASQAFKYVDKLPILVMFALGYASGNFIGITIDEKLSKYNVMAIIITKHDEWKLADILREIGYAVTTNRGYGLNGSEKAELKVIVQKNKLKELKEDINKYDSDAYMVVLDVKDVNKIPVAK